LPAVVAADGDVGREGLGVAGKQNRLHRVGRGDVERVAERRARMEARYGSDLEALDRSSGQQTPVAGNAEVVVRQLRREAQ